MKLVTDRQQVDARRESTRLLTLDETGDGHPDDVERRPEGPILDDAERQRFHDPDEPDAPAFPVEIVNTAPLDVHIIGNRRHTMQTIVVGDAANGGNGPIRLLGRNRTRRRALIVNTTAGQNLAICNTKSGVDVSNAAAFLVPPNIPVEIQGTDELWGYAATVGQAVTVSILERSDA